MNCESHFYGGSVLSGLLLIMPSLSVKHCVTSNNRIGDLYQITKPAKKRRDPACWCNLQSSCETTPKNEEI